MPNSKRVRPACGTWLEITLPKIDPEAHAVAFGEAVRLERILSARDSTSELSALNRGELVQPSMELQEVIALGQRIEAASKGAFCLRDETGSIDLGGIAKGYIVDQVFELLAARVPQGQLMVNAGGDLRVRGAHDIEIRIPTHEGTERRYAYRLEDSALATSSRLAGSVGQASASYANLAAHAFSVCVQAPRATWADALTKVALFGDPNVDFSKFVTPGTILTFDAQGRPSA